MNAVIDKKKLERNLWLLKLHRIDAFIFIGAVFVAYQMHTIGLSLTQILIGESIFSLSFFLFEIPTGIFSDLISRKKTLIIAGIIFLGGTITFALAQNFWHIIVSQILMGAGLATISGTDSSMLYDSLKALGREQEHKKILGGITSFFLIVLAIAQAVGGFLGSIHLRLPELIAIPLAVTTLIVVLFLEEPPREKNQFIHPFDHGWSAVKWIFSHNTILFLIITSALFPLAFKVSLQTFNPYMETIHVPIVYWGILMGIFNLVAAFVAHKAHTIEKKMGFDNTFIFIFLMSILGFVLLSQGRIFIAFLWPLIPWVIRPFAEILLSDEINKRADSDRRATVLSISSSAGRFLQVLVLPFLGFIADVWSLETMYLLMAFFVFVMSGISFMGLILRKTH